MPFGFRIPIVDDIADAIRYRKALKHYRRIWDNGDWWYDSGTETIYLKDTECATGAGSSIDFEYLRRELKIRKTNQQYKKILAAKEKKHGK